ncbi:MAG: hypothetical protein ABH875_02120 [Candidatus Omnitrophota bacterium]
MLGRFMGSGPAVGLGMTQIKASSGLVVANLLVTLGIAVKLWDK